MSIRQAGVFMVNDTNLTERENKIYTDDFREILIKRKELHEQYSILAQWKQWIDDFIEKVKKVLPII